MDTNFFLISLDLKSSKDHNIYLKYENFNVNNQLYTICCMKQYSSHLILDLLQANLYLLESLSKTHCIYVAQEIIKAEICLLSQQIYIQS
uniref:hypothetical protein n=1 Tax=Porphyridium aerugineum TaxID=2792 RepID=UPI001FCD47CC|nr:hypothetical protein MW505_pgp167 [Porphyridium aerugineum]UNJ17830.1 hypothetical protein [Porphyridium aerugineum]